MALKVCSLLKAILSLTFSLCSLILLFLFFTSSNSNPVKGLYWIVIPEVYVKANRFAFKMPGSFLSIGNSEFLFYEFYIVNHLVYLVGRKAK